MEMLYDILLNAGPIGLLALYAIYSNSQSEKRIEDLLEKKEIKEDQIRERWIAVVQRLQTDKEDMEKEIVRRLDEILRILKDGQ